MLRKHFLWYLFGGLLLSACEDYSIQQIPESAQGLAPVYLPEDWQNVTLQVPESIQSPAQLLRHEGFIFVLDAGRGIHLIDNRQSSVLQKTAFWKIAGCKKMAIHDNHLYVNNHHDLLIFRIEANAALALNTRLDNAFELSFEQNFPAHHLGFFECVDRERGLVIDWKDTTLIKPQCWR